MPCLIPPAKGMGYTDLYLDFIADADSVRGFYAVPDIVTAARRVDAVEYQRDAVASILDRQNREFGAARKALDNINLLRRDDTLCVVAGQQAGLLGGPLLVMMKALGVAKAASLYSGQLGRPVIPVFWIAGDDHDFEEINHTWLLDRQSQPVRIDYTIPPAQPVPTAEILFEDTDELDRVKTLVRETLGETDFTDDLYSLIDRSYSSDDTFVSAFGKLMADLTSDTGLVLFSPGDAEVKRLSVPFLQGVAERQDDIHKHLADSNEALVEQGYHLQVEKSEDSSHLFCNVDGRKPVLRQSDGFSIDGKVLSVEQLKKMIDETPEAFSPDVMTRPVFQSWLFPVVSQKAGPSEIAYLAQTGGLFELFGLAPPLYKVRPSATVAEARFSELMHHNHIEFAELTGDIEQVVNRVLSQTFPADLEKGFGLLREDIGFHVDKFTLEALRFDPSLEQLAQHTFGKIDFALKNFEKKAFAAHKKKSADVRDRIYRLHNALYTGRGFQERTLNIAYFLAKYGTGFVSFLYDSLESEETAHQLIDMTGFDG